MTADQLAIDVLTAAGYADAAEVVARCEVVPYIDDGELTAVAVLLGSEFHCHTTPAFRFKRAKLREFMRPLVERDGFLTTRLAHGDTANRRFNKLFGFRETWSDANYNYYVLSDVPFSEKHTCQS